MIDDVQKECIVIVPIVCFDHLSLAYGTNEAAEMYEGISDEVKDMSQEAGLYFDVHNAIKSAHVLRQSILEKSDTRILPLGIHRIDITVTIPPDSDKISLQWSSYFNIPIFLTKEVIDMYNFDVSSVVNSKMYKTIDGGYFVEDGIGTASSSGQLPRSKVICQKYALVAVKGTLSSGEMSEITKDAKKVYSRDGITFIYRQNRDYIPIIIDIVTRLNVRCVIHACYDLVEISSKPHGKGVYCCIQLLNNTSHKLCITEPMSLLLSKLDDYTPVTVSNIGTIFVNK